MPETQDPSSQRGHVYAIDQEHRLVYIDQQARRVFPHARLGSLCYTTMRDTDAPCTDCPLNDLGDEVTCQSVIYSTRLDRWFEITCSRIDWPGHGTCTLFASQPAGDHGRNLFYSFSQPSSYDELFEINVSGNSYKILYHEPDKFVIPALEGSLDRMFQEVLDGMIAPEDRERFADFWDFDTLLERIEHEGGSLRGEFRKKRTDGAWCWVAQTVVPVKRGIGGETVVMCFIADIDDIKRSDLSRLAEDGDIQQLVEKDLLTNLYNATTFYERAEEQVAASPDTAYEAVYVDIEHFKIFNEWHGWDKGDDLLRALGEQLGGLAKQHGGVAGYLGGDDFALLLPRGTVTERCVEKEAGQAPVRQRGLHWVLALHRRLFARRDESLGAHGMRPCHDRHDRHQRRLCQTGELVRIEHGAASGERHESPVRSQASSQEPRIHAVLATPMQHPYRQDRGSGGARALAAPDTRPRAAERVRPRDGAQRLHCEPRSVRVGRSLPLLARMAGRRPGDPPYFREHIPRRPLRRGRGGGSGGPGDPLRHRPQTAGAGDHRKRLRGGRKGGCGRQLSESARLYPAHGRFRQRLFFAQHAQGHRRRHHQDRHGLPAQGREPAPQRKHPGGHRVHGPHPEAARHCRRSRDERAG